MWHEWSPMKKLIWLRRVTSGMSYILKTVTGAIVHIMDAVAGPIDALSVAVEPVQNLNGYDHPWPAGSGANKYNSATVGEGQLNTNNGGVATNANWQVSDYIPMPSGDVTLSWDSASGNFYQANICAYDSDKTFISGSGVSATEYSYSHTFTAPEGTAFVRFSWSVTVSGNPYPRTNVRVNLGSSDLGYTPYSNICPISGFGSVNIWVQATHDTTAEPTATIQLGETVYGGTLDVVTGVVTVTHIVQTPAKSRLNRNGDYAFYFTASSQLATGEDIPCICNRLRAWNGTESLYKHEYYCFQNASGAIRVNTADAFSTAADAYDAIGEMTFVCKLKDPLTIPLTPEQISTLQGTNNVWSDAGNVTMTYRASAS